jgi:glycosyltransferase involved in cell wall biosynthesis
MDADARRGSVRIAYVITRADSVGGATIHVRDLAAAMRDRGHDVLVLVGGAGPVTDQLDAAGVPYRSLQHLRRAIHPIRDVAAQRELIAALREFRPDLVSTHTAKAGWIGRLAAVRAGVPAIYTPHGWPVSGRFTAVSGAIFTVAERAASKWGRAVICVSESERQVAISKRLARPEQLFVIHNGVRDVPPEFRASPECEPVRISSVARFEPPKDHATLLVALAALRTRAWSLDLIGDGPAEARMHRLAERLGVAGRVNFRGYQSDPEPVLAAAHIFVLASRSEAFPRSVLEAMRAGLPVVASDVGGVREAVEHGNTGILVPPEDPQALAAAIDRLLIAPSVRARLGENGREVFEQRFRLEQTVEKTLDVYRAIMDA